MPSEPPRVAENDGSIIFASTPSEIAEFSETRLQDAESAPAVEGTGIPLIGLRPQAEQQKILAVTFGVGLVGVMLLAVIAFFSASTGSAQVAASGQALMQSQRLAKSVSQAMVGTPSAFPEVQESSEVLARNVRSLKTGTGDVAQAPGSVHDALDDVMPLVDRAEKGAKIVLGQQKALTDVGQALRAINRQSFDLLEAIEAILAIRLGQRDTTTAEVTALSQLGILSQRIGKSATEFLTVEGIKTEAINLLNRDLKIFADLSKALLDGGGPQNLPGFRDPQLRDRMAVLMRNYQETAQRGQEILANLPGATAARDAQNEIIVDSEPMRRSLERVQNELEAKAGLGFGTVTLLLLSSLLLLAGVYGLVKLNLAERLQRASVAEDRSRDAVQQEQEAKRVNDANQAAILRLMNELQGVAEGDLTQQATVTEDITGAIADSVNYTVEELRSLVAQVQGAVSRVTTTTEQVEANSTELLATSSEQLREIRDTGESVLQMAGRINNVSTQAQETALSRSSRCRRPSRAARRCRHDRRHERDPRPDPGDVEADQAARRIVAGDRRDHRADLRHHRADERAGAERRDPGGVRGRGRPRLLGRRRGSAAAGRALGRRDAPDRRAGQDDSDGHAGRRRRHGALDPRRGGGHAALGRGGLGAGRHRPRDAPAHGPGRAHLRLLAVRSAAGERRGAEHPAHLRGDGADGRGHALHGADGARALAHRRGAVAVGGALQDRLSLSC
jgi:methyl-accepting chemotaxis protein